MIPVFKAVHSDMSAQADRSFIYPTSGTVRDTGGHGLHGLPYGLGDDSWWYNIRPAKYIILSAYDVQMKWALGKCRFDVADVIGVYDYADEAALHLAHLTDWWQTSGPMELLHQTTREHWKTLIYLAKEADAAIQHMVNQEAIETQAQRKAERQALRQALREAYRNAIYVPSWPVAIPGGTTPVAPPTQNDTAPEVAHVPVPKPKQQDSTPH